MGLPAGSAGGSLAGGSVTAASGNRRSEMVPWHPARGQGMVAVDLPAAANRDTLRPHFLHVPPMRSRSATGPPTEHGMVSYAKHLTLGLV